MAEQVVELQTDEHFQHPDSTVVVVAPGVKNSFPPDALDQSFGHACTLSVWEGCLSFALPVFEENLPFTFPLPFELELSVFDLPLFLPLPLVLPFVSSLLMSMHGCRSPSVILT